MLKNYAYKLSVSKTALSSTLSGLTNTNVSVEAWNNYPIFRIGLSYTLGIVVSYYSPFISLITIGLVAFISLLLVFFSAYRLRQFFVYKSRWYFGLWTLIFFFIIGFIQLQLNQVSELAFPSESFNFNLRISSNAKEHNKTVSFLGVIESNELGIHNGTQIQCYFPKTLEVLPEFGQLIQCQSAIKSPSQPMNPQAFNYRAYLYRKGIQGISFVKKQEWCLVQENDGRSFMYYIFRLRKTLNEQVESMPLTVDNKALIKALLLGNKNDLDPEIKDNYSKAGVIHVLAVSGLHVGIIYIILQSLLKLIFQYRFKLMQIVLVLICLWAYAVITGLSSSVVRAATMFTFIHIAQMLNRQSNILYAITASAFFLLLIKPMLLWDLGFQLSYAALLGIVFLYEPIYLSLPKLPILLDKVWKLAAVSIAAQLATFPLALFYFHQFPSYFLIFNLLIIPKIGIVLYGSILALIVSFIDLQIAPLFWVLDSLLSSLNHIVSWVKMVPGAVISGIHIDMIQVVLIYVLLLTIFYLIVLRRRRMIFIALMALLFLLGFECIEQNDQLKTKQLVIYHTPQEHNLAYVSRKKVYWVASNNENHAPKELQNHWDYLGCKSIYTVHLNGRAGQEDDMVYRQPILQVGAYRILILNDVEDLRWMPLLKLNCIWLQTKWDDDVYCQLLNQDQIPIIIDAGLSAYQSAKWLKMWPFSNLISTHNEGAISL